MIIEMSKVRLLGPRARLPDVLLALQDLNLLHLCAPPAEGPLAPLALSPRQERERRNLVRALGDIDHVLTELRQGAGPLARAAGPATAEAMVRWARLAGRVRRAVDRLASRATTLEEERALILKYEHFFSAFRALLETEGRWILSSQSALVLAARG